MNAAAPATVHYGAPLQAARALCLFLHGRGQSPEEMIAQNLARLGARGIAFVLPRAPGNSWYAARAVDPLTAGTVAQLDASMTLVAELAGTLPTRPLLLAGFSQGACLALELALRGRIAPAALVAFTGCRVGTPACDRPLLPVTGLAAYLSGSDADPWIPTDAFADAVGSLAAGGARLRAESHPGRPHRVSDAEIAVLDGMLADLAAVR